MDQDKADAREDALQAECKAGQDILRRHCSQIMEHFDSVQIFVTRTMPDGTRTIAWGDGNWFARYGQISYWLDEQSPYNQREE